MSVKPNQNWQYVQENFDVARLNSEFMWILQTVGQNVSGQPFTSFGQLSSDDPEMQSKINAEISKAIDEVAKEETHFGKGIAWLPTKDEKGMTRGKLHT